MKKAENTNAPSMGGWIIAAAMGLVAAAVAFMVGEFRPVIAIFIGAIVFLLAGLVLGMPWGASSAAPMGKGGSSHGDSADMGKSAGGAADPVAAVAPVAAPAMAASVASAAVVSAAVSAPAEAAPAEAQSAQADVASADAASAVAPGAAPASLMAAPVAQAPAAKKPRAAAKPKASEGAAAEPAAAKPAAAKPAAAKAAKPAKAKADDGPTRLKAPRKGKADDLKEIEGIGPALEKLCNELGFYHFDQIANWSDADVAWVDQNMKTFKGRIVRDKWVAQAKLIVSEGLDAFRVRAKTNDY